MPTLGRGAKVVDPVRLPGSGNRWGRIFFLMYAGGVALGGIASGQQAVGRTSPSSVLEQPGTPKALPPRTDPASTVTLKNGRLSAHVQNRSQNWILEEISRQAHVAILRVSGSGSRRISVQFQDLSLDEGLREILKDQDAFFFYAAEGRAPASLRAVWVYAKGGGSGIEPVPPEVWASTRELEGELGDPDPPVRTRAIESLIERKHDGARDLVLEALKDGDARVRTQALYRALDNDVKLSTDVLSDLALGDASADVRFLALDALADDPEARTVAERAVDDPSPHVRSRAREILKALDVAANPQAPARSPQGRPR